MIGSGMRTRHDRLSRIAVLASSRTVLLGLIRRGGHTCDCRLGVMVTIPVTTNLQGEQRTTRTIKGFRSNCSGSLDSGSLTTGTYRTTVATHFLYVNLYYVFRFSVDSIHPKLLECHRAGKAWK